jgi:hypothetical protein
VDDDRARAHAARSMAAARSAGGGVRSAALASGVGCPMLGTAEASPIMARMRSGMPR